MVDTDANTGPDLSAEPGLLRSLAANWWLLLLRGIAAIFLAFSHSLGLASRWSRLPCSGEPMP
jgi:hypothetical protein